MNPQSVELGVESHKAASAERIIAVIQQRWQGTLFSMERGSMKFSEAGDLTTLLGERIDAAMTGVSPERASVILRNATSVVLSFLQTKEIVGNIDVRGIADLVAMAIESCKDSQYFDDAEIRIGYGAADLHEPNARAAAYVLPAKKILTSLKRGRALQELVVRADAAQLGDFDAPYRKLRTKLLDNLPLTAEQEDFLAAVKQRVMGGTIDQDCVAQIAYPEALPNVVVYFADHFVAQTNEVDADQAHVNAGQNAGLVRRYIEASCDPEVAARFSFDTDVEVDSRSALARQIEYFAHALRVTSDPKGQDSRDKVLRMGQKHAGENEEGSLRYAAAHAIYSSDDVRVPPLSILQKTKTYPGKLIMIGGEPEKTFWRVRQTVAREASIPAGIAFFRDRMAALGVIADHDGYGEILSMYEHHNGQEASDPLLRVQLICKIGELPVYAGGYDNDPSARQIATELSLDDLVALRTARTSMKEDLLHMIADLADLAPAEVALLLKGKQNDQAIMERWRQGYEKFRTVCAAAPI